MTGNYESFQIQKVPKFVSHAFFFSEDIQRVKLREKAQDSHMTDPGTERSRGKSKDVCGSGLGRVPVGRKCKAYGKLGRHARPSLF